MEIDEHTAMEIDEHTAMVALKSLNESFMRYARIITCDEKGATNTHYIQTFLDSMRDQRDAVNVIVDALETLYGNKGKFERFRISPSILELIEKEFGYKKGE